MQCLRLWAWQEFRDTGKIPGSWAFGDAPIDPCWLCKRPVVFQVFTSLGEGLFWVLGGKDTRTPALLPRALELPVEARCVCQEPTDQAGAGPNPAWGLTFESGHNARSFQVQGLAGGQLRWPGSVHFPEGEGRPSAFASETASLSLSRCWTAQILLA